MNVRWAPSVRCAQEEWLPRNPPLPWPINNACARSNILVLTLCTPGPTLVHYTHK